MTDLYSTAALTVVDLIREGRFETAVIRMRELCRIGDPTDELDVEQVRKEYEATRDRLKAVVPPAPLKVVVEVVRS